jgi:hypothetical protein
MYAQRNNETLSLNDYCRGNNKYYISESVCAGLIIRHAKCIRHILSSVASLASHCLSTLFGKQLLNIKCVFLFSLQRISEKCLILIRIQ